MNSHHTTKRRARLFFLSLAIAASTVSCASEPVQKAKARQVKVELSDEYANFSQWGEVSVFLDQMVTKHGFNKTELETLLRKTHYVERAIQLMKPAPPGRPKNWAAYRARFVEPVRINAGVAFWETHADALARAEARFGVPADIIVGIIGVETVYGRNTGNFRVMDAVTTLAFAYPETPTRLARMTYFKGELENTLLYARENGIDPFSLLGSYAGAIGWPQFMPSSMRTFGIDFDGDGKVDLRNSPTDAIGSVANFLVEHGWTRGQPLVFPATVTAPAANGDESDWNKFLNQSLEAKFRLDELKAAGVAPTPSIEPPAEIGYGLVDLQNGQNPTEYWIGTANFFAITQYNRSFFYAMSVIDLGRAVRAARAR